MPLRVHAPERAARSSRSPLIAIRHAAHPAVPLHRRLLRGLRRARARVSGAPSSRRRWPRRLVVLVVGYLAVVTIGLAQSWWGSSSRRDAALNLPARFDAGWYGGIALDGYSLRRPLRQAAERRVLSRVSDAERAAGYPLGAFAPGVPSERRMARLLWGGVFISLIAFAWAAVYLWRLARDTIGEDRARRRRRAARRVPVRACSSARRTPNRCFSSARVATIYHFRRDEFVRAAAWGLLVGLTRPNGCFLSIVLALLIFETTPFL